MPDYEDRADLITGLGEARHDLRRLRQTYFDLRQEHFGQSRWWTRGGAGTPQELAQHLHDALSAGRATLRDYWYYPSGKHNPYLDVLYAAMPAAGFHPRELATFDQVDGLAAGSVVHLHWIESLRPNGTDASANLAALDRARTTIERFVAETTNRFVWSVHEPLPHGTVWPDHDAEFHQFLSDHAHVIHVLHESTARACSDYFELDQNKTASVGLPLYDGVYPNYRQRDSSRLLLDVEPDELCVVFFGAIRAYKGLDELVEATSVVSSRRRLRLLVAGMPVGDVDDLVSRVRNLDHASVSASLVPDSEIQTLLGAADVVVVPYKRFLNSAVLMLALSFGVPVIATRNPVTSDAEASGAVSTYSSSDELVELLAAATINPEVELEPAFVAAHSSRAIGEAFADLASASVPSA